MTNRKKSAKDIDFDKERAKFRSKINRLEAESRHDMEKPKKKRLFHRNRIGDYSFLWIWKACFVYIRNAEHTNPNRFIEIWKAKKGIALIVGKIGIGIGYKVDVF